MKLKSDVIAEAYRKIGIDAINVGELDLALGSNYLIEKEKDPGVPLISSNLTDAQGKAIFNTHLIKDVGGVSVGIFGLLPPLFSGSSSDASIKTLSPSETARDMVKRLRNRVDIVILLSNLGRAMDEKLAKEVPGIDVIVGGRDKSQYYSPLEAGGPLILQTLGQGKVIGRLDLHVSGKGDAARLSFAPTAHIMDEKTSFDGTVDAMVKKYKETAARLNLEQGKITTSAPIPTAYTGETACAGCHIMQSAFWRTTKHAIAYDTLEKTKNHLDLECIGCHTTGFNTPGGYRIGMDAPNLRNVQCEVCHGAGSGHRDKGTIRKAVVETLCRGCHDSSRDLEFNYEADLEKVRCPK